jgi:hypothetical protein
MNSECLRTWNEPEVTNFKVRIRIIPEFTGSLQNHSQNSQQCNVLSFLGVG